MFHNNIEQNSSNSCFNEEKNVTYFKVNDLDFKNLFFVTYLYKIDCSVQNSNYIPF